MWGNHCEYIYTNRQYGNGGAASAVFVAPMQRAFWGNPNTTVADAGIIAGLNCNLAAIESHNPNLPADEFRWIPQGLPYDLIDNRNDNVTTVLNDNVSNYTNNQIFTALQSNIQSIPAFRNRLLLNSGNNQQAQVNQLLDAYNY